MNGRLHMLLPVCLLAASLLCLAVRGAGAYTVYGYEDELGMLHLSKTKRDAKYKELYSHSGKTMNLGYKGIIPILREKSAIAKAAPLSRDEIRNMAGARGAFILQAAEAYLGAPYVFGGDLPSGVDCSGFTRAVFRNLGADIPRNSRAQSACGVETARESLLPGDLVFFASSPGQGINHVGIYLGEGRMIHSSSRTGGVTVQALAEAPYAAWYVTARRVPLPERNRGAADKAALAMETPSASPETGQ